LLYCRVQNVTWFASPGCTGNVTEKDTYVVGKCNNVSKKQSVQVRGASGPKEDRFQLRGSGRDLRARPPCLVPTLAFASARHPTPCVQVVCIAAAEFDEME